MSLLTTVPGGGGGGGGGGREDKRRAKTADDFFHPACSWPVHSGWTDADETQTQPGTFFNLHVFERPSV